jgi:hypothetical protein
MGRSQHRLFTAVLVVLISCQALAQHQRLGLAPGRIPLEGESEAVVEAICLDQHLLASRDFVPYTEVLNETPDAFVIKRDGGRVPLAQAIKEGLVTISGASDHSQNSGLALKFQSHSPEIKEIVIANATAFGERPGGLIASDSPLLGELAVTKPNETSREKNNRVWKANEKERILQELGYYPDSPVSPHSTEIAIRKFQESHNLGATGLLDSGTSAQLHKDNEKMLSRLSSIGFRPDSKSGRPQAISEPLRDFQRYHDLPETGVVSNDVFANLSKDEEIAREVTRLSKSSGTVDVAIESGNFPHLLTFYRTENGIRSLIENGSQKDYWEIGNDGFARAPLGMAMSWLYFRGQYNDFLDKFSKSAGIPVVSTNVSKDELTKLKTTRSAQHPEAIMVAVHPFQQGRMPQVDYPKATEVARALRHYFGSRTNIFIGQDAQLGVENASNLPILTGSQNIRFYVDGKLDDRGIVKSLEETLSTIDIDAVEADDAAPGKAGIGIVVGKNDENMREVLLQLARQSAFKDGILAIAKCGSPDDITFNSRLIHESNARAVIFYDEKIQPQAVKRVLVSMVRRLKSTGLPDGDWTALFHASVRDAASKATGADLNEILKLNNAHIQTSEMESPLPNRNGRENV